MWTRLRSLFTWKRRAAHLDAGSEGERLAAKRLRVMGYRIVARNIRFSRAGEIDLVAEEGGDLVFIEVKARRARGGAFSPFLNITPAKQRKLVYLAQRYCAERNVGERSIRFDVVGVEGVGSDEPPHVTVIKAAFVGRR